MESKAPFFVDGTRKVDDPGRVNEADYGYAPIPGGVAVTVPGTGACLFLGRVTDPR